MLGTSGTVTTIAGVHLRLRALRPPPRRRLLAVATPRSTRVIDRLIGMSYEERAANACIGAERADLVLAGCAILDAHPPRVSAAAAARRRSRPARGHAGRDDARGRRLVACGGAA